MFLPLFSVGISMMISRPVPCEPLVSTIEGRRYEWSFILPWGLSSYTWTDSSMYYSIVYYNIEKIPHV